MKLFLIMLAVLFAALPSQATVLTPTAQAAITDSYFDEENGYRVELTDEVVVDWRLERADAIAVKYWGRAPDCADRRWFLMRQWSNDVPAGGARGERYGCKRWITEIEIKNNNSLGLCEYALHETGHNLGYKHEIYPEDPNHVMTDFWSIPVLCGPTRVLDGKTRSPRKLGDRTWCRKHVAPCKAKYPALALRAL